LVLAASVYFVNSSLPHSVNNLLSAGWAEYKVGRTGIGEEVLGPERRPGYLEIISALNVKETAKPLADVAAAYAASKRPDEQYLAKLIVANGVADADAERSLKFLFSVRQQLKENASYAFVSGAADRALATVASKVLTPSSADRNEGKIFRLGTFMTYHISQNLSRFFEDSLLTWFDRYVADADPDVSADRIKALGFQYVLADLNAATIDRDPRHDLTRRYEGLLWSFYSKKLELIHTDNLCIRVAREIPGLTKEQFIAVAGTNYESYVDGRAVSRGAKLENCANFIANILAEGKGESVPSIAGLAKSWAGVTDRAELVTRIKPYISGSTWMASFRVK